MSDKFTWAIAGLVLVAILLIVMGLLIWLTPWLVTL